MYHCVLGLCDNVAKFMYFKICEKLLLRIKHLNFQGGFLFAQAQWKLKLLYTVVS